MSKIYLSSKGIRPDIDNAGIINRAIETAKEGSTLVWKEGNFPIGSTILQAKKLHWEGADETMLVANGKFIAVRFMGGYKSVIEKVNFKGTYDIYQKRELLLPGIQISSITHMKHCMVRNFWGSGIEVSNDIAHGGGNASKSKIEDVDIVECGGHGLYFQGGDANQCGIYDADIRDCQGVGVMDASFLGNQFYGCMTHNNKEGSFAAIDGNNRAGFYGCYAEGGQPPVYLAGASTWHGGFPSDGIIVDSLWANVYTYATVEILKQPTK